MIIFFLGLMSKGHKTIRHAKGENPGVITVRVKQNFSQKQMRVYILKLDISWRNNKKAT